MDSGEKRMSYYGLMHKFGYLCNKEKLTEKKCCFIWSDTFFFVLLQPELLSGEREN